MGAGLPGCLRFGGGGGYIWGEHSVEDHYLHKNGIIFGGSSQFVGGETPPKNRPPWEGTHGVCWGGGMRCVWCVVCGVWCGVVCR